MPLFTTSRITAECGRNGSEEVTGISRNRWPESSEYAGTAHTETENRDTPHVGDRHPALISFDRGEDGGRCKVDVTLRPF